MSKALIVFSGFNTRAVIAFLRTLESNNIKYGIIAKSKEDDIFLTKYEPNVLATRSNSQLEIDDLSVSIKKLQERLPADEYVIAPSTEALNRHLLEHRSVINELRCSLPLVDKELYETVSDKHAFGELCKTNGILVPSEFDEIESAELPLVAKPKTYFSKSDQVLSPVLIFNQTDRKKFLDGYEQDDFYFQEYVEGDSYYLLYYFYENGDLDKFSQKNLMQQPEGKSIVGAESSTFHLTINSEPYERLFKSISFRGMVMVEVKQMDGKVYMIEANPRFWGPSQLFVDAKANLFEAFLADHGLLDIRPTLEPQQKTKYFWQGGITYADNLEQVVFHGYNKASFEAERVDWQAVDVYNREDTANLYKTEIRRRV